jgi:quinoprotein glucose dehydrogenase
VYQQNCQECHGPNREGVAESGAGLVYTVADPANNIQAGAPRYDAARIRDVVTNGYGRMDAFPHLTAADLDNLVAFLTTPVGGRGRGAGGGRGRGAGPVGSGAPPELIAGSGSAWTRPETPGGGRGRGAMAYPEGVPNFTQYRINEYHTVGRGMKPPYTKIVKYDLNEPSIKWSIGYGDDPELAARGITGTGVPGIVNQLIVTESGLVFGAGLDNQIRAWDSDTGRQLWSSRFGGNFVGSPVMYETAGRQYLVVPAAGTAGGRGRGAGPAAAPAGPQGPPAASGPMGWVAYALPGR